MVFNVIPADLFLCVYKFNHHSLDNNSKQQNRIIIYKLTLYFFPKSSHSFPMQQSQLGTSENQFNPTKAPYLKLLQGFLQQNKNHQSIKATLKAMQEKVETLQYYGLVKTQAEYLEKIGLYQNDEDFFYHIGQMLDEQNDIFQNKVIYEDFNVKSNLKPPPEPEPQPDEEIVKQVQYVLNNVDLPLSLFKRSDNYWSIDNPKTLEANEYLKNMHIQDRKFKTDMKKKRQKLLEQKQKQQNKTIDIIRQSEQEKKQQMKAKIQHKLESLKRNSESRQKAISQSVQFMKERGNPLYKKIQKEFQQKVEMPSLQEKKKKLFELRQMKRSVPIEQIQSHRQKYQKAKSEHQAKTIFTENTSVSFKSHFYKEIANLSSSRYSQMDGNVSLIQKMMDYSRVVKEQHKPSIDYSKVEEMQNKLKEMNKRRARRKNAFKRKRQGDSDQDSEQEEPEPSEESEEEPEPDSDDSDDSDNIKPEKDDQYEPTNKQRYKMGMNYLKVARQLAAKKPPQQTVRPVRDVDSTLQDKSQDQNKTIDFNLTHDEQSGQQTVDPTSKKQKFVWVSKYDQEPKKNQRIKYKNYLREMQKTDSHPNNEMIDTSRINTSRVQKTIDRSYQTSTSRAKNRYGSDRRSFNIEDEILYQTNLQNQIRHIEERARNQEQLLKFKRVNKSDKIQKKMAIDNAVVDTIKARLSLMHTSMDK